NLDWKRPPSDKPEPAFTVQTRMHSTRASPTRRAKRCAPRRGLPRSLGGPLAAKHARAVRSGAKKWAAVGEGIGAAGALLATRGWPQSLFQRRAGGSKGAARDHGTPCARRNGRAKRAFTRPVVGLLEWPLGQHAVAVGRAEPRQSMTPGPME